MSSAHFTGGQTQWGPDAFFQLALWRRLGAELRVGTRWALPVNAPDGTIHSRALTGALGATINVHEGRLLRFDLTAGMRAANVSFQADPGPTAEGGSASAFTLTAYGGARLSIPIISGLRFGGGVSVGAPLRSVSAVDNGVAVSGVRGVELTGNLGLAWSMW